MNEVDNYIAGFPEAVQQMLLQMRSTIKKAAPAAAEKIGYGIPTFTLYGNLVHYAAFKNHIGFYPGAEGIERFAEQLKGYQGAKGSVQFPFGEKLPLKLVGNIVNFRVQQNEEKALLKKLAVRCSNGHVHPKNTPCPLCKKSPVKETGIYEGLSAPAKRALENAGIKTLETLSTYTEREILLLHGVGPSSLPLLKKRLAAKRLAFKKAGNSTR